MPRSVTHKNEAMFIGPRTYVRGAMNIGSWANGHSFIKNACFYD